MKINKFIIPFAAAALIVSGCDSISPDERYIEVEAVKPKRAVLLEEFTGQNCTNCPEGHKIVAQLREQYGSSFIPVSIHASSLSIPTSNTTLNGLGTPEGETYYNNAGKPVLPTGVVDRRTKALGRDDWAATVRQQLERESPLTLEVTTDFDEATKSLSVNVNYKPTADIDGNIQLWLIESGIVGFQLNGSKYEFDYVHNHVFRATINGTDGETFRATKNVFGDKSYTYTLAENWKPENMAVVAFVYDSTGVLQATEAELIPDDEPTEE